MYFKELFYYITKTVPNFLVPVIFVGTERFELSLLPYQSSILNTV